MTNVYMQAIIPIEKLLYAHSSIYVAQILMTNIHTQAFMHIEKCAFINICSTNIDDKYLFTKVSY